MPKKLVDTTLEVHYKTQINCIVHTKQCECGVYIKNIYCQKLLLYTKVLLFRVKYIIDRGLFIWWLIDVITLLFQCVNDVFHIVITYLLKLFLSIISFN